MALGFALGSAVSALGAGLTRSPRIMSGPGAQRRAPEIEHGTCRRWQRYAGERFADQGAHGLGQWHILARGHPAIALAAAVVFEIGVQVGSQARHAAHAEGLAAALLDGVKHLPRLRVSRPVMAMQLVIVMAQAQSDGIGFATGLCGFHDRQLAARHGEARLLAHQALTRGHEAHFDVVTAGERANTSCGVLLEGIDRILPFAHGCLSA